MSGHKSDVVTDSLLLLELALVVGRMLEYDLEQRCQEFLRILMARKNLAYGAVWIRSNALRRDADSNKVELIFALPQVRGKAKEISLQHSSMAVLRENRIQVVRDTDSGFSAHVLETNIDTGSFASFRLGNIGVLRLYSIKHDAFSAREVNQLFGVIETFAISIEGALSQSRLEEEAKERELIERRLFQAQKMEAVGQLTGGIAHDFNNLLAAILGHAENLEIRLGRYDKSIDTIIRAADRGAELTQRLLAFSRRQPLNPRSIGLDDLVGNVHKLLHRTLGETIEIEIAMASSLWNASADSGQLESALLNLAINSRDAMPGGGKLSIECHNTQLDAAYVARNPGAVAGEFVVLAVSDTGEGMSEEVQAHVFEPFFTTKELGRGSGLGLSMIYGFVKQSGGHVTIYSELGKGTTVKLYLPRSAQESQNEGPAPLEELPLGQSQTVLVIEDNEDVRDLAAQSVEKLGYRAIAVPEVAAARAILDSGAAVDVILSDVILPGGTSGPEFAEELSARGVDLPVIFMSGYPAEAAKRNGFIGFDKVLLNKPFRQKQLAEALRDALS